MAHGHFIFRPCGYQHCIINRRDRLVAETEEITLNKDYSAQKKHIRTHYARFPLDLRPEVLEEFKKACEKNSTTPTTEIKKFIASYCEAAREE